MSDVTISYKGNSIATMSASGTKTLLTEGKYCEDDITIDYVKPSAPAPNLQAKSNISPTTSSQTITADNGYDGLSSVQINGDQNLIPGNIKDGVSIFSVQGNYTGGGGGVQTGAVTISGDIYYTDASMQYHHDTTTLVNEQLPLGSLIARSGPAEPGSTESGVTQVYFSRTVYIFKVTG